MEKIKQIKVNLGARSYSIMVGAGLLKNFGKLTKTLPNVNNVLIITNKKIKSLYGQMLAKGLHLKGITSHFIIVADSEKSKSINVWLKAIEALSEFDKGKGSSAVIALGGGVIGDLAGFVAASYRRGISLIQVPTTLLAQVDSSIGGKTAIDMPFGKNLIGAYYQPKMVISDINTLKTLPACEIRNGIAEIIKYAIIMDKELFIYLEKNITKLLALRQDCLLRVVEKCSQIKAKVVSVDEKESTGYRLILNFGHTIAHALEASAAYSAKMPHGYAVSLGMLCACDIANSLKILGDKDYIRIEYLIKRAGLPSKIRGISFSKVINAISYDKKIIAGKLRFILPEAIGHVMVCKDIKLQVIKKAVSGRMK